MTTIYDPTEAQQKIIDEIRALREQMSQAPRARLIAFDQVDHLMEVQATAILRLHEQFFAQQGIEVSSELLPATATQDDVLRTVRAVNADPQTHAITVLLPGPSELNLAKVVNAINPAKEIEGLGWDNISAYLPGSAEQPRTRLIVAEVIETVLASAPFSGVGDPTWVIVADRTAMKGNLITEILAHLGPGLVWNRDADIRFIPADAPHLLDACRQADRLLVAVEKAPGVIGRNHVKPGAAILDFSATVVGVEAARDGSPRPVFQGAVRPDEMDGHAGFYCPAPRGCGPLLLAGLARNAVASALAQTQHA